MSCHDIGRGMNSVVRTTVKLMDEKKISKDAARTIICCCSKSVNWCDGNESEAVGYIRRCMCGRCMKMVPEGEKLYSVYNVSNSVPDSYKLSNYISSDGLCEKCFDLLINEYCKDETAGLREREYIEKYYDVEDYTSTGEYEDHNNGCRWVDYDLA